MTAPDAPGAHSTCRSCKALIEWAVTDNGRKMPLDLGWHADGRLVVVGRKGGDPLVVSLNGDQLLRLHVADGVELALRRSHFATCPDADQHRRR